MRTLTPDDIKRENAYRAAQRKAGKSRKSNIKDPNAPKKPLSAYFMFLQRIRANPHLVHEIFGDETETTKQSVLAAAKWRSMTDDERKVSIHATLWVSFLLMVLCSLFLRRPNRRRWSTKLREGYTKREPLRWVRPSISASCLAVRVLGTSRWSLKAKVKASLQTRTIIASSDELFIRAGSRLVSVCS